MNKNRYRLVHDKRTGKLIPVAEFTTASKKNRAGGTADGMGETTAPTWRSLSAALAMAWGGVLLPAKAQVVVDTSSPSHAPTLSTSINETPMVDIVDPNAAGLSHNRFLEFNVGADGLIFNNSRADGVSLTGGLAMKNPHLTREATGILAEVTGIERSKLEGQMEVFGGKADLLIANPKNDSVYGDTGAYLSSTWSVPVGGGWAAFMGADAGVVQDNGIGVASQFVSGGALGLRGNWRNGSVSLTHAAPFRGQREGSAPDVLYAMASVRF